MSEFAVSALARKRAELAGEIQATEVRLRELRANLAHVDATIRLFAPGYPIAQIAPKKPQPERPVLFEKGVPRHKRGESTRRSLGMVVRWRLTMVATVFLLSPNSRPIRR
jgi:hypothetical protein